VATNAKGLHRLPDGKWRFRLYIDGRRAGRRKLFTLPKSYTPAQALALYRAEQAKAAARAGRPLPRGWTLADAGAEYQAELRTRGAAPATIRAVESQLRIHLVPTFGTRRLDTIRPADVESWAAMRAEAGAAPASINLLTATLRAIVRRAVTWGWIDRNPLPPGSVRPRPTQGGRITFLSPEEWQRFQTAIDDPLRWEVHARAVANSPRNTDPVAYRRSLVGSLVVFRFLLFSGSRIGEACGLTWENVDLEAGTVTIPMPKVRRPKLIPLSPELRSVLEARPRGTPAGFVFTTPARKPWTPKVLSHLFYARAKLAGIRSSLSPHSLRHTFASWAVAAGEDLVNVRDALGHSNITQTAKYSHLNLDALRKTFEAVGAVEKSFQRQTVATSTASDGSVSGTISKQERS
jgi:integrase